MRSLLVGLAVAVAVTLALPAKAQPGEAALQTFTDRVLQDYLQPSAASFEREAGSLAGRLGGLCENPGEEARRDVETAFRSAVDAWGSLAFLALDPMRQEDRQARVFFWPDPRGFTLRQVQAVLAEEDPTAVAAEDLGQKSVAVQGFGALEFLLFGSGSDLLSAGPETYRCRYALAIAHNLHGIGQALSRELAPGGEFAQRLSSPGPDNKLYRNAGEAAEDLIGGVGTGIEFIRDRIVRPALGEGADSANGKLGPFWRSDQTVAYLEHMIVGMRRMLAAGGIAEIVPEDEAWLAQSIDFELRNAEAMLGQVEHPFAQAVENEEDRQVLIALLYSLGNARTLVAQQLMGAAGLRAGFNALDGD